jgi:hypothetical protein
MTWDYLCSTSTDFRLWPIVGYLRGKTRGRTLVDLNCLQARLALYVTDCARYLGNDLVDHPDRPKSVTFSQQPDDAFCRTLPACDVLVVLGYCGRDFRGRAEESATLDESVRTIVARHRPAIVILEGVQAYGWKLRAMAEESRYLLRYHFAMEDDYTVGEDFTFAHSRELLILERPRAEPSGAGCPGAPEGAAARRGRSRQPIAES